MIIIFAGSQRKEQEGEEKHGGEVTGGMGGDFNPNSWCRDVGEGLRVWVPESSNVGAWIAYWDATGGAPGAR